MSDLSDVIERLTDERNAARADRDSWKVIAQQNAEAVLVAVAKIERVRELADSVEGIHNPGCEGEAECAACWQQSILRALDGAP